jgi:hypothetical protein
MSTYALLQAAAIGGNLFVLGIVIGRWRTAALHRAFLLFLAASLGWAAFTLYFALPASEGHEVLAKRLAALFWIPLNFWILRFMYLLLERKRDALYYLLAALTAASVVLYDTTGVWRRCEARFICPFLCWLPRRAWSRWCTWHSAGGAPARRCRPARWRSSRSGAG